MTDADPTPDPPPYGNQQSGGQTQPRTSIERYANVLITVLGAITALLLALTGYLGVTKSDVTAQRDDVQSQASTLATQQSQLKDRVAALTSENADLRRRLKGSSRASGPASDTSTTAPDTSTTDVVTRPLSVPLPDQGRMGVDLDEGRVSTDCCDQDFYYERQESTGRPQLVSYDSPYSTAVDSSSISQEDCSQAVATSPTITPIRPLRSGLLICATTRAGTSLLQVLAAPAKNGTLKISQRFWPQP